MVTKLALLISYRDLSLTVNAFFFIPQEAPRHLLGRNHPLVKQAERIPFKQPDFEDPFSIYYDSEEGVGGNSGHPGRADDYLLYNYDYVDEGHIPNVLPIINHRGKNNDGTGGTNIGSNIDFLPTPLPPIVLSVTSVPTTVSTTRKSTTTTSFQVKGYFCFVL